MGTRRPDEHELPDTVRKSVPIYQAAAQDLNAAWKPGSKLPRLPLANWVDALELVISNYLQPTNWRGTLDAKEALPPGIAKLFLALIRSFRAGFVMGPFNSLLRPGRPGVGPFESYDIAIAVSYIRAARSSIISNRRPIATIAEKYGVEERSVRRWLKEYAWLKLEDIFWRASPETLQSHVVGTMEEAAARYRIAGRSARANRERAKKRRT